MDESSEFAGVIAVILAQMSTTRLPGKVLLPLGEHTVLEQVVRRVRAAGVGEPLVAIPDGEADLPLRRYCAAQGLQHIVSSEEDATGRLCNAAHEMGARWVVRCLASQPLIDPAMLSATVQYVCTSGMDMVTVGNLPYGVACDAFPRRSLDNLCRCNGQMSEVGRAAGLYNALTTSFERALLPAPRRLRRPHLRLSLDTEEDYWFLKRLFSDVPPRGDGLIAVEDVIGYIESVPDLLLHGSDGIAIVQTMPVKDQDVKDQKDQDE
jgi:spore coat polysaccharide biosynthesis protein SpsF